MKSTNINHSAIVLTCQGKQKYAGGFKWEYIDDESIKKIIYNSDKKLNLRKILQYDLNGDFIKEWESIASAERFYNVYEIGRVCQGKRNDVAGFKWKYKEN